MMDRSYALTDDGHGKVMVHRWDCPQARAMAAAGEPVVTLLECRGEMPADIERHQCMNAEKEETDG